MAIYEFEVDGQPVSTDCSTTALGIIRFRKKCECGCGRWAPICIKGDGLRKKGMPGRFILGHATSQRRKEHGEAHRIRINEEVRQFVGMCLYMNPLKHSQIYKLVADLWPGYSSSGLGQMLKLNCEGMFKRAGSIYYTTALPCYWKDSHAMRHRVRELLVVRMGLPEFTSLAKAKKPRAERRTFCAYCGTELSGKQRTVCSRSCKTGMVRRRLRQKEFTPPALCANDLAARDIQQQDHDELLQLALSIATSISWRQLADVIGPTWEGVQSAYNAGLRSHKAVKQHAMDFVKRHWRAEHDYGVRSLDAMKSVNGFEPAH